MRVLASYGRNAAEKPPLHEMSGRLYLLTCRNFQPELEAALALENWPDVAVCAYPALCGKPPMSLESLRSMLPRDCTGAVAFGRSCLPCRAEPADPGPVLRCLIQEHCFHLIASASQVDEAIAAGAYLMTPAWLRNWRVNLDRMGFDRESLRSLFHEFASRLVLLDTGTAPDALNQLSDLGRYLDLPTERLDLGLAHLRLNLRRMVEAWRRGDDVTV